jgi:uncharacterized protein YwqG
MKSIHFQILNEEVLIGQSKIGGLPHLRRDEEYPINERGFFEFVVQLNFEELNVESKILPKKGILNLFVGAISQNEYECIFYPELPDDLEKKEVPRNTPFLGDTDFTQTKSGKFERSIEKNNYNDLFLISESWSHKDPVYLKIMGFGELETNILFDYKNNYKVDFFGRISGVCKVEDLIKSKEECFQLGKLSWEEWKDKIIQFDRDKKYHEEKYKELICLLSIPTNYEVGMVWGDMGRVEFFIMKEDLISKRFDKMIVKYAPD